MVKQQALPFFINQATGDVPMQCKSRSGEVNDFEFPHSMRDYQNFMGGVDLADQRTSSFHVGHKTSEWTRHIFF